MSRIAWLFPSAGVLLAASLIHAAQPVPANSGTDGVIIVPPNSRDIQFTPDYTFNRQLDSLIIGRVNFRDSDFMGAVRYLRQKAQTQSAGAINPEFVLMIPPDFKPRHELSLDLHSVPFRDVLNYLGTLAGVRFSTQSVSIIARVDGPLPYFSHSVQSVAVMQPIKGFGLGLGSAWRDPPVVTGNGIHRDMQGLIQPELSGYIPHRSMGAWPVQLDPLEKLDVEMILHAIPAATGLSSLRLQALIIPGIQFKDATFSAALEFLKQQAAKQSVNVSFVPRLSASQMEKTYTVNFPKVSFLDALNYFCISNGAYYSIEPFAIVINPAPPASVIPSK
jgi:hypothetical protein